MENKTKQQFIKGLDYNTIIDFVKIGMEHGLETNEKLLSELGKGELSSFSIKRPCCVLWANRQCNECNGTRKITLLNSIVDCKCVNDKYDEETLQIIKSND